MGFVVHDCGGHMEEDREDFYYHGRNCKIECAGSVLFEAVDEDLAEAGLVELNFDE